MSDENKKWRDAGKRIGEACLEAMAQTGAQRLPDGQAWCECGYIYFVPTGICTKCGKVHPVTMEQWAESVAYKLAALSKEQRLEFIGALTGRFCIHCGNDFETGSPHCCVDMNAWYDG